MPNLEAGGYKVELREEDLYQIGFCFECKNFYRRDRVVSVYLAGESMKLCQDCIAEITGEAREAGILRRFFSWLRELLW